MKVPLRYPVNNFLCFFKNPRNRAFLLLVKSYEVCQRNTPDWYNHHVQLTDEQINTFRTLHFEKFGVEITKDEALSNGLRLVRLMEIILEHRAKKKTVTESEQFIENKN